MQGVNADQAPQVRLDERGLDVRWLPIELTPPSHPLPEPPRLGHIAEATPTGITLMVATVVAPVPDDVLLIWRGDLSCAGRVRSATELSVYAPARLGQPNINLEYTHRLGISFIGLDDPLAKELRATAQQNSSSPTGSRQSNKRKLLSAA